VWYKQCWDASVNESLPAVEGKVRDCGQRLRETASRATRRPRQEAAQVRGVRRIARPLAAIDGMRLAPGAVARFHRWETGFLAESPEFWRARISTLKTIFSPYLTTGRLAAFVEAPR
jgi:hypothetical protein